MTLIMNSKPTDHAWTVGSGRIMHAVAAVAAGRGLQVAMVSRHIKLGAVHKVCK
jgi:hypothetical protein